MFGRSYIRGRERSPEVPEEWGPEEWGARGSGAARGDPIRRRVRNAAETGEAVGGGGRSSERQNIRHGDPVQSCLPVGIENEINRAVGGSVKPDLRRAVAAEQ